ncbi:xylose isomerase, partial [Streptomyces sp. SID5926]|nr:xylose isomerase [Streptomyces sp. SID5926]
PLRSTRPELVAALTTLLGGPAALTDHVEVETYTWPVLPGAPDGGGLVDGIAGELAWTRDTLTALGLTEENTP